jgi:hypothetical protein
MSAHQYVPTASAPSSNSAWIAAGCEQAIGADRDRCR